MMESNDKYVQLDLQEVVNQLTSVVTTLSRQQTGRVSANTCRTLTGQSTSRSGQVHHQGTRQTNNNPTFDNDKNEPSHSTLTDSDDEFQPERKKVFRPFNSYTGKRYTPTAIKGGRKLSLKNKQKQRYGSRTVVCIPLQEFSQTIQIMNGEWFMAIPRCQNKLKTMGLHHVLQINNAWNMTEMKTAIINAFGECFSHFSAFDFLVHKPGLNLLTKAAVDDNFMWNARAVLALNTKKIYICTKDHLAIKTVEIAINRCDMECNDTSNSSKGNVLEDTSNECSETTAESSVYNEYVNLIASCNEEFNCSSDDSDGDIQQAIQESLLGEPSISEKSENNVTAEQCLQTLQEQIDESAVNKFHVIRSNILDGAVRTVKRKFFKPMASISVEFSDENGQFEGAVDAGGPTREFLRLVMHAITNSIIFEGKENKRFLTHNPIAVAKDLYYIYGTLISLTLLHGGPGPKCFSKLLYSQILNLPRDYMEALTDMTDIGCEYISQLQKIHDAISLDELNDCLMDSFNFLKLAGCHTHCTNLTGKNEIIKTAMKFYTEGKSEPLHRFSLGLNQTGLLEQMKNTPNAFKMLFIANDCSDPLSGNKIIAMFSPKLSESGSNKRHRENLVLSWWRHFVDEVGEKDSECSLQGILIFATGADEIPPLGFSPPPTLQFTELSHFPLANTCSNILSIPLQHDDYEAFKSKMEFGICNSPGFGRV